MTSVCLEFLVVTVGDITTILGFFFFDQKPCNSCGEKLSAFFVPRSTGAATMSPCGSKMALKKELSENSQVLLFAKMLTSKIVTFNRFADVLAEFCSDLLARETFVLPLEVQEEQTSFFRQDLCECLLVVGLSLLIRSCLVGVDGSWVHEISMQCVALSEVSSHHAFYRVPACHEDGGKPHLQKSPSGSSGKCPSTHEIRK